MLLKFCGLTRLEDFRIAERLGTDFVGFIFHSASPRFVPAEAVGAFRSESATGPKKVGVFVDANRETILETVRLAGLDLVQLHGRETPEFAESLGVPWWKAFRVAKESDLDAFSRYPGASALLVDAFVEGLVGGTGKRIDVGLVKAAIAKAKALGKPLFVAGGLGPENLAEVVAFGPDGTDVNSGVESAPGRKDPAKMEAVARILGKEKRPA